jgi:hypothetical protein
MKFIERFTLYRVARWIKNRVESKILIAIGVQSMPKVQ